MLIAVVTPKNDGFQMKILIHESYIQEVLKKIDPPQHVKVIRVVDYYNEPIHPEAFLITGFSDEVVSDLEVPFIEFNPHPQNKKHNEEMRKKIEGHKKKN